MAADGCAPSFEDERSMASLMLAGKSTNDIILFHKIEISKRYYIAIANNEDLAIVENMVRNMLPWLDNQKLKLKYIDQFEGYLLGIAKNTEISETEKISQKKKLFAACYAAFQQDIVEFGGKTEINCVSRIGQELTEQDCDEFIGDKDHGCDS